jgi:hypothetical protein
VSEAQGYSEPAFIFTADCEDEEDRYLMAQRDNEDATIFFRH